MTTQAVDLSSNQDNLEPISLTIPDKLSGMRIDQALAELIPELSRTKIVTWLKANAIIVNGITPKAKYKVLGGETVVIIPILSDEAQAFSPEDIAIDVVYEDEHLIVINKPAGLVVHPGNGNWHGTLLNALLFHYPELQHIPRAGIVHRLDKDTSGLMVVARTLLAQTRLVQDLQERKVTRIYRAIVEGHPHKEGVVNKNIGRDLTQRTKMAVLNIGGKQAITHYRVLKYFDKFSYIECKLETGRTHQIRVHMQAIHHPLVGDKVYNHKKINYAENIVAAISQLNRQALHAIILKFNHPANNQFMEFKTKLPQDIKYLLAQMNLNDKDGNSSDDLAIDDEDDIGDWEIIYAE